MRFADEPLYQFYAADISEVRTYVFVIDLLQSDRFQKKIKLN